jgi:putative membrane protein
VKQTTTVLPTFLLSIKEHSKWVKWYIAVTYLAGIIGLTLPASREIFLQLTPFHLVSSMILLLLFDNNRNKIILNFTAFVLVYGFALEAVGVNTGIIFGNYVYGEALGPKIWGTPLLIGVNWFILSYSIGILISRIQLNNILKIMLAAFMMTLIDVLIEPVAIELNFWNWEGGVVPYRNYLGWFLGATVIFTLWFNIKHENSNRISNAILIAQVVFFGLLLLIL